jgi:cytochrome oxidase assembly protein ShyY1
MRRFLTPRFVALHLLVVVLVVVMVNLGFWQLSRLDEKRAANAIIEARADDTPVEVSTLRSGGVLDPDANEWRPVVISGSYDTAKSVTVLNRSSEGIAGTHSVVPFRSDEGRWIWVNRGFVPLAEATPVAPTGSITVIGHLKRSEKRGTLGAVDSTDADTVEFQRLDVPLLNRLLTADDGSVETMFLLLAKETPETSDTWPARIPLPPLDEGSHLSYAGQWFLFSAVAVGGWLVIVRRTIRQPRETTSDAAA